MFTALTYVSPRPGKQGEARAAIRAAVDEFLAESGCESINVDFDDDEGVIIETWDTPEDFNTHITSEGYARLDALLDPLLRKPLQPWPFDANVLAEALTII